MTEFRQVPAEADWETAPRLVDGATSVELTPSICNLDYWFSAAAQGTLRELVHGHAPDSSAPDFMREEGPLRSALVEEFAFRAMSEEKAARGIAHLVANAPDIDAMEFFTTQLLDEARHARVFRGHLLELGVAEEDLFEVMEQVAGKDRDRILVPVEEFALPIGRDQRDFVGGAVVLTILVEGVLAPLAELSERKWRPLDPAAADIERGANIDEVRHLTVGSWVVREHLRRCPGAKARILDVITKGRQLWNDSPTPDVIYRRERLYQQGMECHTDLVGDYEISDGRRLVDTSAEERLQLALEWSNEMQESRLVYMGLPEAVS